MIIDSNKAVNELQIQTDIFKHFVYESNMFKSLKIQSIIVY